MLPTVLFPHANNHPSPRTAAALPPTANLLLPLGSPLPSLVLPLDCRTLPLTAQTIYLVLVLEAPAQPSPLMPCNKRRASYAIRLPLRSPPAAPAQTLVSSPASQ